MSTKSTEGKIHVKVTIHLQKCIDKFEKELPFKILNYSEFNREVIAFTRNYMIEKIATYGTSLPEVMEFDLLPIADNSPTLLPILQVDMSIEDFEVNNLDELKMEIRDKSEKNLIDEFFDDKILHLLTQRIVQAERRKAA